MYVHCIKWDKTEFNVILLRFNFITFDAMSEKKINPVKKVLSDQTSLNWSKNEFLKVWFSNFDSFETFWAANENNARFTFLHKFYVDLVLQITQIHSPAFNNMLVPFGLEQSFFSYSWMPRPKTNFIPFNVHLVFFFTATILPWHHCGTRDPSSSSHSQCCSMLAPTKCSSMAGMVVGCILSWYPSKQSQFADSSEWCSICPPIRTVPYS